VFLLGRERQNKDQEGRLMESGCTDETHPNEGSFRGDSEVAGQSKSGMKEFFTDVCLIQSAEPDQKLCRLRINHFF
jgi:hypothetical protein